MSTLIGCKKESSKKKIPIFGQSQVHLIALDISEGTLSPAFSQLISEYTVEVAYDVSNLTVTPSSVDNVIVQVNDIEIDSGIESELIDLDVGTNEITIKIISLEGKIDNHYTILVNRIPGPSHNAKLADLLLSIGTVTPQFDPDTIDYTVQFANSVETIRVTPTAAGINANISVNGITVASGTESGLLDLSVGENVISVDVSAEDGIASETYTVTITRLPSDNAFLSGLEISEGEFYQDFERGIFCYSAHVSYETTSYRVTPTAEHENATITVNGDPVLSGAESNDIELEVGQNRTDIIVTAENGIKTNHYVIEMQRLPEPSNNCNLSSFQVTGGSLDPAFDENTLSYSADVSYYNTSVRIRPFAADANATIRVDGEIVSSGGYSQLFDLIVGDNGPIPIEVTAENGTSAKTYEIMITRLEEPNHNADLADCTISEGTLKPFFDANQTFYTARIESSTITVTPTLADSTASVSVNGNSVATGSPSPALTMAYGNNPVSIVVTAEDGFTIKTYSLTLYRPLKLAKTGQTMSYHAGDDGDFQNGAAWPEPRFIDHGNGTITDIFTGLMWTDGFISHNTWSQAFETIDDLNSSTGSGVYQYSDWRVPNMNELLSLLNAGVPDIADWLRSLGFSNMLSIDEYWSSNISDSSIYANGFNFSDLYESWGYIWKYDMLENNYIIAVRNNPSCDGIIDLAKTGQTSQYEPGDDGDLEMGIAWPNPRFIDNGDSTITDILTGLMWAQPHSVTMTWEDALDYIDGLNEDDGHCGYTDWRLPNINEFRSLVKRGVNAADNYLDSQGFIGLQTNQPYWSSTTSGTNTDKAWTLNFSAGTISANSEKTQLRYVWAVRSVE